MSDAVESIGYFVFFWLFLFNKRYRSARIAEWRDGGGFERAFLLFEAAVSILVGVVVPVALLWALLKT
jgi:hypothetical protein